MGLISHKRSRNLKCGSSLQHHPVATKPELSPEQLKALARTRDRMRRGRDLGGRMPPREALHER